MFTFLVACCDEIIAANILHISVNPSPSHHLWDITIAKALWRKGHNITFVTLMDRDKSMENFTIIHIEGVQKAIDELISYEELWTPGPIETANAIAKVFVHVCEVCLKSKGIQKLITQVEEKVKYDLIIFDVTCGQCLYPLIQRFNSPPVIGTSPFGVFHIHHFMFGSDLNTAYIPIHFLPYSDEMTFFQRLVNHIFTLGVLVFYHESYWPAHYTLAVKYFGNDIVPFDVVVRNISILLANYDPNLDYPMSLPPGVIPVGGLSIGREKAIPQDLLQYLDNAKDGVILFSLGTNVPANKIAKTKIEALLKAFEQLNQTVLWKCNADIKNLPENVITRAWLPQNDILAHPNVKLFITHGGGLSIQEAIYHEVPVVGIPFYADHEFFMKKVLVRKLGVQLDYAMITAENVLNRINEVINNPIYKKNIKTLSTRYKDQPQDALTRAVFWVEYVLRHGGAQHLRIGARDMNNLQIHCLDIWAFLITVTITLYFVTPKLIRCTLIYYKSVRLCKLKSQ